MLYLFRRRVAARSPVTIADAVAIVARRLTDPGLSRGQRVALKYIAYHLASATPVTPWSEAARKAV